MKKYTKLDIEITSATDIITTSGDVTTGGVKFPWSTSDDVSASSYELVLFEELGTGNTQNYRL